MFVCTVFNTKNINIIIQIMLMNYETISRDQKSCIVKANGNVIS